MEKRVFIDRGTCHTCGSELTAEVRSSDFAGEQLLHGSCQCGQPGHNEYPFTISRSEFDATEDGGTIEH